MQVSIQFLYSVFARTQKSYQIDTLLQLKKKFDLILVGNQITNDSAIPRLKLCFWSVLWRFSFCWAWPEGLLYIIWYKINISGVRQNHYLKVQGSSELWNFKLYQFQEHLLHQIFNDSLWFNAVVIDILFCIWFHNLHFRGKKHNLKTVICSLTNVWKGGAYEPGLKKMQLVRLAWVLISLRV